MRAAESAGKGAARLDALQAKFLEPLPRICPKCGQNVVEGRARSGFCRACDARARAFAYEQLRDERAAAREYGAAHKSLQREGGAT